MKGEGPKAPTAVQGHLGITHRLNEKANVTEDCLENQFASHDLCDENHERRVETSVQALLASVDDNMLEKVRPCGIQKLVKTLKLRRACGLDGIPNECLKYLPRRLMVHLTHLFDHYLQLHYVPKPWKEASYNVTETQYGLQTLRPISFLSIIGKLFEKVTLKIVQRHIEDRACLMQASLISVPVTAPRDFNV
jgi:hypothetical protein